MWWNPARADPRTFCARIDGRKNLQPVQRPRIQSQKFPNDTKDTSWIWHDFAIRHVINDSGGEWKVLDTSQFFTTSFPLHCFQARQRKGVMRRNCTAMERNGTHWSNWYPWNSLLKWNLVTEVHIFSWFLLFCFLTLSQGRERIHFVKFSLRMETCCPVCTSYRIPCNYHLLPSQNCPSIFGDS